MSVSLPRAGSALLSVAVGLLVAGSASAITEPGTAPDCPLDVPAEGRFHICFDDLLSLTAASSHDFGPVSIVDATVVSEDDAETLLFLAPGDADFWASSGDQGILNDLTDVVGFSFDTDITLFRVSVVPDLLGAPVPVVAQGYRDGMLIDTFVSADGDPVPDSDAVWLLLKDDDGFDEVRLFAALGPCTGADCQVDPDGLFFADTVKYVLAEPGTLAFLLLGLGGLTGIGRRKA